MSTLPELIKLVLDETFGFEGLRPEQTPVIDRVLGLSGEPGDALVVWPTGSGKSLCYQLPALVLRRAHGSGVCLVFSPLIALMEDQVSALRARGVRAQYVNSTVPKRAREKRMARLGEGGYDIFYATPERMDRPGFLEALRAVPGGVRLLAVDEAHCISKWGHDLRPAYQRVGEFRRLLGSPRTVALTATATREVREDIRRVLGVDERAMPLYATGIDRPNLELQAEEVWDDGQKLDRIVSVARGMGGTGIVYFALIKDLERMAPEIRRRVGHGVEIYHGRLDAKEKKRVYRRFMDSGAGDPLVLCATNAFGMGVDKADIRSIVHAQAPGSVEAYAQEVGRAGRDGERSACLLLYTQDDLAIQHEFVRWMNPSADLLMTMMSQIARRYGGDTDGQSGHAAFDADDLRLDVVGKGHAHGMGGGVVEYALITLAKLGAIEPAGGGNGPARYRFVRELDDAELDAGEIEEKTRRDLARLLEVVKLVRSGDVAGFVRGYFD